MLVDGEREDRSVQMRMLQLSQQAGPEEHRRALQVNIPTIKIFPVKLDGKGKRGGILKFEI